MFRSGTDVTLRVLGEVEANNDLEYYGCDLCTEGGWTSETEVDIHKATVHAEDITNLLASKKYLCRWKGTGANEITITCYSCYQMIFSLQLPSQTVARSLRSSHVKMCISKFKCALDLLKHIKTEHLFSSEDAYRVEREIFICSYCSQIFFNKALLTIHIRHFHYKQYLNEVSKNVKDTFSCPKCNKIIRVYSIWFHFQTHGIQSVSLCRICLSKCKNKKQLQSHMKVHQKLLRCEICGYDTKREDLFKKHVFTKHKMSRFVDKEPTNFREYFYPPLEILLSFNPFSGLKGLVLTNKVKICILCREICVGEIKMKKHILEEHAYKEEVVRCEYSCSCGETFTNKILLIQHTFKLKGDHKVIEQ